MRLRCQVRLLHWQLLLLLVCLYRQANISQQPLRLCLGAKVLLLERWHWLVLLEVNMTYLVLKLSRQIPISCTKKSRCIGFHFIDGRP